MAAPVLQAVGTATSSATATTAPAWPTHATDDVAILFIECAGGDTPALTTANGFVRITGFPYKTGAGTAGTQLDAYWCRATSGAMSAPVVSDAGNHHYAIILTYRGCIKTGDPWDQTTGGVKAGASTTTTVTGVTTTVLDTLVVQAVASDLDSAAAFASAQTNANLGNIQERTDAGTTIGGGGGIAVTDGVKGTAGATGSTTVTVTSSISAFATIALRPPTDPTATYRDHIRAESALVAYWPLGDNTPGAGTASAANDKSDLSGAAVSAPTTGVASGVVIDGSTAMTFNGSSQYVQMPVSTTLHPGDTFSFECWMKRAGTGTLQVVWGGGAGTDVWCYIDATDHIVVGRASGADPFTSTATLSDTSSWHHVVWTKNGTGTTALAYLDGALLAGSTSAGDISADTTAPRLGCNPSSVANLFNGSIAHAALYNAALTAAQIADHHSLGKGFLTQRPVYPQLLPR